MKKTHDHKKLADDTQTHEDLSHNKKTNDADESKSYAAKTKKAGKRNQPKRNTGIKQTKRGEFYKV